MLQGLPQFCIAVTQFLEEPHVLDGHHRLVGEGFDEQDLLACEGINYGTTNENGPNRNIFPHERYSKYSSIALLFGNSPDFRKLSHGYRRQILNMDWLTIDDGSAAY